MDTDLPIPSSTYKLRPDPNVTEHAVYFTVVGAGVPEAFFVNCKDMQSFQWITALMTSYSKQLGAGLPITDIIKQMSESFSPNGHYITPGGIRVNSIIHHLGLVLERHMASLKAST